MKFLAFILSVYIMGLSFVPCSDGIVHNMDDMNMEVEAFANHNDHDHSDHEDHCTTFCSCACCGSFTTAPNSIGASEFKIVYSAPYSSRYTFQYSFEYIEGIWHPPSIG